MGQRVIACQVVGEYVAGDGVVIGAAGSHDEVIIELDFAKAGITWEGTTKTVTFTDALGLNPINILLTATMLVDGRDDAYNVPVPNASKIYPGKMGMTVAGVWVDGDTEILRVATEVSPFRILPDNMVLWEGDEDVPASAAEQLQAQIDVLLPKIATIDDSVATAVESAETASEAVYGIENMTVTSETLDPGEPATVTKTSEEGVVNLHFGLPTGAVFDEHRGERVRFWFGTLDEYNALEEIDPDVYYNIEMGGY